MVFCFDGGLSWKWGYWAFTENSGRGNIDTKRFLFAKVYLFQNFSQIELESDIFLADYFVTLYWVLTFFSQQRLLLWIRFFTDSGLSQNSSSKLLVCFHCSDLLAKHSWDFILLDLFWSYSSWQMFYVLIKLRLLPRFLVISPS